MKLTLATIIFVLYLANHGRAQIPESYTIPESILIHFPESSCRSGRGCDGGRNCYFLEDECDGRRACEDGSDEDGIQCDIVQLIGGLTGVLIFIAIAVPLIIVISVHCYRGRKRIRSHRSHRVHLPPPVGSTTKRITAPPTVSKSPNAVTWSPITESDGDVSVATGVNSEQSKAKNSSSLTSTPPPPYSERDNY